MDPLSGLAIAGTLILTKAFEKQGEKLGDVVWKKAEGVMGLFHQKAPATAVAIEQVTQQPELAAQQPAQYGQEALSKLVEELVVRDVGLSLLVWSGAGRGQRFFPCWRRSAVFFNRVCSSSVFSVISILTTLHMVLNI